MSRRASFVTLVQEAQNFFRHQRDTSPALSRLLKKELLKQAPEELKSLANLQTHEKIFLAVVAVEPGLCRDLIREFAKFWTTTLDETLLLEMEIKRSLSKGPLKEFIKLDETGSGRDFELVEERQPEFIKTIITNSKRHSEE